MHNIAQDGIEKYIQKKLNGNDLLLILDTTEITGEYYLDIGIGSHSENSAPQNTNNNQYYGNGEATITEIYYYE